MFVADLRYYKTGAYVNNQFSQYSTLPMNLHLSHIFLALCIFMLYICKSYFNTQNIMETNLHPAHNRPTYELSE